MEKRARWLLLLYSIPWLYLCSGVSAFEITCVHSSLQQWNLICSRNDARVVSDNDDGYITTTRRVVRRGRPYRFLPASVWLTRTACSPLSHNAPIILERSWEGRNNSVITSGTSPEEQRARWWRAAKLTNEMPRMIPITFRRTIYLIICIRF